MKKLCWLVLLVCGCIYFESVHQPPLVATGERFTITITGKYDQFNGGCPGFWYLAMMMPKGFQIDSIRYISSGGQTGLVTDIDSSFLNWFSSTHPCDTNMSWLAYTTTEPSSDSYGTFTANVYTYASDTTITGQYLIDYYIGYTIGCGTYDYRDSVLNRLMMVYPSGISYKNSPALNTKQTIYPTLFHDRLNIDSEEPSTFDIYSSNGRLIRSLHIENTGFWDGRDAHGVRVSTGDYFIIGNDARTKVTVLK